jgi:hypothetical protein
MLIPPWASVSSSTCIPSKIIVYTDEISEPVLLLLLVVVVVVVIIVVVTCVGCGVFL